MTDPSEHPEALGIFAEYGIQVVPAHVMPSVGQTRAIATLDRIRNRHGEAHARFVVMTLSETANNKAFIDETSLWVVSNMVRAATKNYPDLVENNVSAWFAFFDGLPLGWHTAPKDGTRFYWFVLRAIRKAIMKDSSLSTGIGSQKTNKSTSGLVISANIIGHRHTGCIFLNPRR